MKGPKVAIWWYDLFGSNSTVRYRLMPSHYCLLSRPLSQHNSVYGCKLTRPWLRIPLRSTHLPEIKATREQKKRSNVTVSIWPRCDCKKSRVSKRVSDGCDTGTGKVTPSRIPLDDSVSKLFITPTNNWNQTLIRILESPFVLHEAKQAALCNFPMGWAGLSSVPNQHSFCPWLTARWVRSATSSALL